MVKKIPIGVHVFTPRPTGYYFSGCHDYESVSAASKDRRIKLRKSKSGYYFGYENGGQWKWIKAHRLDEDCPEDWF